MSNFHNIAHKAEKAAKIVPRGHTLRGKSDGPLHHLSKRCIENEQELTLHGVMTNANKLNDE